MNPLNQFSLYICIDMHVCTYVSMYFLQVLTTSYILQICSAAANTLCTVRQLRLCGGIYAAQGFHIGLV